jgi:hypothetical protein
VYVLVLYLPHHRYPGSIILFGGCTLAVGYFGNVDVWKMAVAVVVVIFAILHFDRKNNEDM